MNRRCERPGRRPLRILTLLVPWCLATAALAAADGAAAAAPDPHVRPLHLGGYASVRARDVAQRSARVDVRDLSLFVSWLPSARWRTFGEFEVGQALVWRESGLTTGQAEFDLERLYAEYDAAPALRVRVGKFLTPVGRWNLIHADPLVWTVTRPLTSGLSFARHATGLYVEGSVPVGRGELGYILYADDSRALDPDRGELSLEDTTARPVPNSFEHAVGGRLHFALASGNGGVGISYIDFRMQGTRRRKHLFGLHVRYQWPALTLSSEFTYRLSEGGLEADEWGGFVQGVVPVWHGLHFVGRYEFFRLASTGARVHVGLAGLAWRLQAHQVVKLEYRNGANNGAVMPDGWLASYAILF